MTEIEIATHNATVYERQRIIKSLKAKHKRMASKGPGGEHTTWKNVAKWLEEKKEV